MNNGMKKGLPRLAFPSVGIGSARLFGNGLIISFYLRFLRYGDETAIDRYLFDRYSHRVLMDFPRLSRAKNNRGLTFIYIDALCLRLHHSAMLQSMKRVRICPSVL